MIVNHAALAALDVSFKTIFNKALEKAVGPLDAVTSRVPSATASEKYPLGALTGGMRQWIGDRQVGNLAAFLKTVENLKFEQTIGVLRDHIEDDTTGVYRMAVEQLAAQAEMHPWELLETLLGTTAFTALDGVDEKAFFSATHTWPGAYATSQDNLTDELLDSAAVYTGLAAMSGFKGPDGKTLRVSPTHFLYAPSEESRVDGLFNQATLATGESNPHFNRFPRDRQIKMHGWSGHQWVMLDCSKPVKPCVFQERRKIELVSLIKLDDENVFSRDEFLWGTSYRGAVAAIAWWLAYGSNGEGS